MGKDELTRRKNIRANSFRNSLWLPIHIINLADKAKLFSGAALFQLIPWS